MSTRWEWITYRQRHELARRNGRTQRELPSYEPDDDLAPARGILIGLAISLVMWVVGAVIVRWWL